MEGEESVMPPFVRRLNRNSHGASHNHTYHARYLAIAMRVEPDQPNRHEVGGRPQANGGRGITPANFALARFPCITGELEPDQNMPVTPHK